MIYVDTNVLIRLMTNDVPKLREQAEENSAQCRPGEQFIADIVLTELFFVLEKNPLYRLGRDEVCERVNALLQTASFAVSKHARSALSIAKAQPKLDFTDCLLAVYGDSSATTVMTFDKDLLKILT